jgi:predicted ester cyclase
MVHKTLANYRCIIEKLVEEGDKIFAKMTFTGIHKNDFMGYSPSQKHVNWKGCTKKSCLNDMTKSVNIQG